MTDSVITHSALIRACTDAIRSNIEYLVEAKDSPHYQSLLEAYLDYLFFVLARLTEYPEDAARILHSCAASAS